jgi:hypothetical protein
MKNVVNKSLPYTPMISTQSKNKRTFFFDFHLNKTVSNLKLLEFDSTILYYFNTVFFIYKALIIPKYIPRFV